MEINKNKIKKSIIKIKKDAYTYIDMHPIYQHNEEIASEALSLSNKLYNFIPKELKENNSFLIKVLNKSIYPFYRFSDEKKKDIEILKVFLKKLTNKISCEFYNDISKIENKDIKNIFHEKKLKNKEIIKTIYSCCVSDYRYLNREFFYNMTPIEITLRQGKKSF